MWRSSWCPSTRSAGSGPNGFRTFNIRAAATGAGSAGWCSPRPPNSEVFLDEDPDGTRAPWSPPPMSAGLHGGDTGPVLPLRVIIDDACGTPEDWAGLTGSGGYAGTVFIRLAAEMPPRPGESLTAARYWVGFDPSTTYRLVDGALRKRLPPEVAAAAAAASRGGCDELEEAFYARGRSDDGADRGALRQGAGALPPGRDGGRGLRRAGRAGPRRAQPVGRA